MPLLATQILWVNLLTDSGPALAIGLDPPPDDVMARPPRRLNDRVIDREMWIGIVWVGLVTAVVTLTALDLGLSGGLIGGARRHRRGRTMALTTLVFAQLFNAFNARSDRVAPSTGCSPTAMLWAAIALSVAAAGRSGRGRLPQRRVRHDTAVDRQLADLHRPGQRGALGRGGKEAARSLAARRRRAPAG